ncbi:MAG TPA: plastocyanin/azurin family copper-binding protein [Thermoleophilaceae bacterium]|nr:plastocyanin/azurin family copper-binding protein [Thermoleophilaceae bacterium]
MTKWLALLCSCLLLALAGCGGDDDDGGEDSAGGGEATQEEPASGDSSGGAKKSVSVSMKNIKFAPATVTVAKGGKVSWKNDDTAPHDVTADEFKSGEAGGMKTGDTFEHTFETAGSFGYVCTVHPGMEGTVEVK